MARTPPKTPGRRNPENLYVLLELGDALENRLAAQPHVGPNPATLDELCQAALRRLPEVQSALAQAGVGLNRNETKRYRGLRRRSIQRSTWNSLAKAAAAFDLSRPQLLRALLRLQFQTPPAPISAANS